MRGTTRRQALHSLSDGLDVRRGRATAAAHDVQPALFGPRTDLRSEGLRCFWETCRGQRIGQSGIGIHANFGIGDAVEFLDVGPHFFGTEGAVKSDGDRLGVADRVPKGFDRLPRQRAARQVGDRARDHQRQSDLQAILHLLDGQERGLGVERVEDGFHQQDIHAPFDERLHLFGVSRDQLLKTHGPESGIVDIRRDRGGDRHRSNGPGNISGDARGFEHRIDRAPGQFGRSQIHFPSQVAQERILDHIIEKGLIFATLGMTKEKVVLADGRRRKRVRFNEVGPGLQIVPVNFFDDLRLGDLEQLVVALEVLPLPIAEALASKLGLAQFVTLDDSSHGSINDGNALFQQVHKSLTTRPCIPSFGTIRHALRLSSLW